MLDTAAGSSVDILYERPRREVSEIYDVLSVNNEWTAPSAIESNPSNAYLLPTSCGFSKNKEQMKSLIGTVIILFVVVSTSIGDPQSTIGKFMQFPRIESNALRGNLIGDPASRGLTVLLPPSYFRVTKARFPVVYYLHGLGSRSNGNLGSIGMFENLFKEMEERKVREIILVAVDGTTSFGGSYYAESPTIGNFEKYVGEEIVSFVDSVYRTKRGREWRAITGFSMGGHGAIKLGMKYSGVFGQIASLSGSPLSLRYRKSIYKKALEGHTKPKSLNELVQKTTFEQNWSLAAAYAKAAAFSPNVAKPPLFLDLPFESSSSDERDPIWQKWLDDDPLSLVARYKSELGTMDQIYIDHGEDETTLGTEDFVRELVRYGIGFTHFIFRGDHVDELFMRHVRMLQFLGTRW